MNMIHNLTASSILNQLNLRTSCRPGDNLFSYNTKRGGIQKNKMQNIKSWLTANTVKNHMIFRCNSCRCRYKKNTEVLFYICTYSN